MKEILSIIPVIILAILLFLMSNYFSKGQNESNYDRYFIVKTKLGKTISIFNVCHNSIKNNLDFL